MIFIKEFYLLIMIITGQNPVRKIHGFYILYYVASKREDGAN